MKKFMIALVMLCCLLPAYGQEKKKTEVSMNIFVNHDFMLGSWFDEKAIDKAMLPLAKTELGGRLNLFFGSGWGIWGEAAIGNRWGNDSFRGDMVGLSGLDPAGYYVVSEWEDYSERMSGRLSIGVSRRFGSAAKWRFIPSLGLGMEALDIPQKRYTLKEKGTNNVYYVDYGWLDYDDNELYYNNDSAYGFFYFDIKAEKRMSDKLAFFFALSYKPYFTRAKFKTRIKDRYDYSLKQTELVKGNFVSTLGLSAGISF